MKDIVATKANYSDLVMYFDKKADKKDVADLLQEIIVNESPKAEK